MTLKRIKEQLCWSEQVALEDAVASFITDELEPDESSLFSRQEVSFYLKTHEVDGLKTLDELTKMKLPNSCQLRAPLFTEDVRKEVLRLVEMARTGHTLNYNSIFDHFPGEKTPLWQPDSRVIENLMTALSFKSDTGTYDPLRSGYPSNHVKILLEWNEEELTPPSELFPSNVEEATQEIWLLATHRLLQEAWIRLFRPRLKEINDLESMYLKQLSKKFPVVKMTPEFSFSKMSLMIEGIADASGNFRKERHAALEQIKTDFRASLEEVMKDVSLVKEIFAAATASYVVTHTHSFDEEDKKVQKELALGPLPPEKEPLDQITQHIETMREYADGSETEPFVNKLNRTVKAYAVQDPDFSDVDVAMLTPEEAAMGYQGIYSQ